MGKAVTSPAEWRRRAAAAEFGESAQFPAPPPSSQGRSGGWPGQSGQPELGASALGGWAALEAGDDDAAHRAAVFCRRFAWEQPEDAPGVLIGWDDDRPAEPLLLAHTRGQPFGDIGAAVAFLARSFEEAGDDVDLDSALELHDLVVALGEAVWEPANALVGCGGALLYRVTGEDAFLATAERMADVLCETQALDGTWAGDAELTALAAGSLAVMADAVEARAEVAD